MKFRKGWRRFKADVFIRSSADIFEHDIKGIMFVEYVPKNETLYGEDGAEFILDDGRTDNGCAACGVKLGEEIDEKTFNEYKLKVIFKMME